MSTSSRFNRNSNKGEIQKELKRLQNKLTHKTRDLDSRNKLITKLNAFLAITNSKTRYHKETQ